MTDTLSLMPISGPIEADAAVNFTEFAAFRSVFGLGPSIFDDSDDETSTNDFAEFRKRFAVKA